MTRALLLALAAALSVAAVAPIPEEERARAEVERVFGAWTGADSGCTFRLDGDRLRVRLPDQMHALSVPPPYYLNPPRFLRDVNGDFTAVVRVTCQPRDEPQGEGDRWVSGGLVVQDGRMSYLVRRMAGCFKGSKPALITQNISAQNGCTIYAHYPKDVAGPTFLRLTRAAGKAGAAWSPDGVTWTGADPVDVTWGPKVRVGIVAENSVGVPVEVTFDRYTLMQPKKGPEGSP
jgi:hypothetical protein